MFPPLKGLESSGRPFQPPRDAVSFCRSFTSLYASHTENGERSGCPGSLPPSHCPPKGRMPHLYFILLLFNLAMAFLRWIHPCDVGQSRCKCFTSSTPALSVCWEQRGRWNEPGSVGHRRSCRAGTSFPLAWLSFPRQLGAMAACFQGVFSPDLPAIHPSFHPGAGRWELQAPDSATSSCWPLGIYWTL